MTKRYEQPSSELGEMIDRVRGDYYHDDLQNVEIGALFVASDKGEQCLTHHGYPANALCRIVPARDRAAGMPDAQIIVDRFVWQGLNAKQKNALLDHELHHIETVHDEDGEQVFDAQDRPKLKMRRHDYNFGWFDEIAKRHGANSFEVRQAREIIEASGQLYFDFGAAKAA